MREQPTRSSANRPRGRGRAFTLIELVVAVVIVSGIASAVTVAIAQALRAKTGSGSRASATLRADAAAGLIARDVQSVVREGDLYLTRLMVVDKQKDGVSRDEVLVFANLVELARPTSDVAEGGVYEVQYRVADETRRTGRETSTRAKTVLWRRMDPMPDEMSLGGGVVFPVVEGVVALSIDAFDGEAWATEWDSDRDGLPHAVRISVVAESEDGERLSTVRRVVAIDRVPLVYDKQRTFEDEGGEQ